MVSISICFKWSLYEASVRIQDRIQTPRGLGSAWWKPLHPIFSKGLARFTHYKQVAWWIANSVSITTLFRGFWNLTLRIHLFQVFCAFSALANPTKLSMASIAILHQSSGAFSWSIENILLSNRDFRQSVSSVRKMCEAFLVMNSMSDGTLAYPPVSEKGDISLNGMSFKVKYVDSSHHQCLMLSYSLFTCIIY